MLSHGVVSDVRLGPLAKWQSGNLGMISALLSVADSSVGLAK
jgi:hypothetical protein